MARIVGQKLLIEMNWAAVAAAKVALRERSRPSFFDDIETKEDGTKRTPADVAAQKLLEEKLEEIMPGAAFVGEETTESAAVKPGAPPRYRWMVDPVDGTNNFINGHRWAVSVALQEWDEKVERYESKAATILCVDATSNSHNVHGMLYCSAEKPALQVIRVQNSRPEQQKKNYKHPGTGFKNVDTVDVGNIGIGIFERDFLRRRFEPRPAGGKRSKSPLDDDAIIRSSIAALLDLEHKNPPPVGCICQAMMDLPAGVTVLYANGLHHEYDAAAGVFLLGRAGIPTVEYQSRTPNQSIVIASKNETLFKECVDILQSEGAIRPTTEILHAHNTPKNFDLVEPAAPASSRKPRRK